MTEPIYAVAIDPSLNNTGYCVAKITPQRNGHKVEIIEVAHIPNKHFSPDQFGLKLKHIERRLCQLRDVYHPVIVGKEDLAVNNIAQAERLAPIHGIVHMVFGDDVAGYSPTNIKKVVTGDGKAEKEDIAQSIQVYLLEKKIQSDINLTCYHTDDESDAIGIMITMLIDKCIIA